jgi:hypothetical protein
VVGVERIGEHPLELELADAPADLADVALDRDEGAVVVLLARHREELVGVADATLDAGEAADDALEGLLLLAELLRALGVVPDLGILELARDGL